MAITLPDLPYPKDALQPYMSKETLDFHHDKHHKKYVTTLNELIKGTGYENDDLEEIVIGSFGNENEKMIFNNAGQAWNHNFFWQCLTPKGTGEPGSALKKQIIKDFGTLESFKKQFTDTAVKLFGSGWAWLTLDDDGRLFVEGTTNANNPTAEGHQALLTCDVWEHAYYIDYRNERPKFVEAFWNLVNWDFVGQNLELGRQIAGDYNRKSRSERGMEMIDPMP